MAFTVEDGTGVANANSLCSVEFADSYFADRGVAEWTVAAGVKQSALVRASDYVETRFSARFIGEAVSDEQALSWPRENAGTYPDNVVPTGIRKAVAEYALRALSSKLAPDPVVHETGRAFASKTEKVGPISESVTFAEGAAVVMFKPYPAADLLLAPFLRRSGGLVRA